MKHSWKGEMKSWFVCITLSVIYCLFTTVLLQGMDIETNPGPGVELSAETQACLESRFTQILHTLHVQGAGLSRQMFGHFHCLNTAIHKLQDEVGLVQRDVKHNRSDISELQQNSLIIHSRLDQLENKLEKFDTAAREKNLVFFGVYEPAPWENYGDTEEITATLNNHSTRRRWEQSDIERTTRIGQPSRSQRSLRPLVVTFRFVEDKVDILKDRALRASLRQHSNIKVSADLTRRQRDQVQQLRDEGKVAYYWNGHLHVDNNAEQSRPDHVTQQVTHETRSHSSWGDQVTQHENYSGGMNGSGGADLSAPHGPVTSIPHAQDSTTWWEPGPSPHENPSMLHKHQSRNDVTPIGPSQTDRWDENNRSSLTNQTQSFQLPTADPAIGDRENWMAECFVNYSMPASLSQTEFPLNSTEWPSLPRQQNKPDRRSETSNRSSPRQRELRHSRAHLESSSLSGRNQQTQQQETQPSTDTNTKHTELMQETRKETTKTNHNDTQHVLPQTFTSKNAIGTQTEVNDPTAQDHSAPVDAQQTMTSQVDNHDTNDEVLLIDLLGSTQVPMNNVLVSNSTERQPEIVTDTTTQNQAAGTAGGTDSNMPPAEEEPLLGQTNQPYSPGNDDDQEDTEAVFEDAMSSIGAPTGVAQSAPPSPVKVSGPNVEPTHNQPVSTGAVGPKSSHTKSYLPRPSPVGTRSRSQSTTSTTTKSQKQNTKTPAQPKERTGNKTQTPASGKTSQANNKNTADSQQSTIPKSWQTDSASKDDVTQTR